jgi:hypothetical protein
LRYFFDEQLSYTEISILVHLSIERVRQVEVWARHRIKIFLDKKEDIFETIPRKYKENNPISIEKIEAHYQKMIELRKEKERLINTGRDERKKEKNEKETAEKRTKRTKRKR